ncbi:hypothetical protein [Tessaracoccus sp. OH4464_COT-324]|uniref:hypothetical protein n=1 Tax=Tessaracoccus sp. OH4464_COT-324 TaxID=2491059 RepID=UPI000F638B5E|nr:hypothetical protein [Tessaracoccus sp. OH4464_COT-324]RRD45684.1 hypothetical protein EII42_10540 [Tessaracoccus sp. OH4464_COT-324]
MGDGSGFSPTQICDAAKEVLSQGAAIKGLQKPVAPSVSAFSAVLSGYVGGFLGATRSVGRFIDAAGEGVERMGQSLIVTADSYYKREEWAAEGSGESASTFGSTTSILGPVKPHDSAKTGRVGTRGWDLVALKASNQNESPLPKAAWSEAGGSFTVGSCSAGDDMSWLDAESTGEGLLPAVVSLVLDIAEVLCTPLFRSIERFLGIPGSISHFESTTTSLGESLGQHAETIKGLPGKTPDWFGEAFDNFSAYVEAEASCMQKADTAARELGALAVKLGSAASDSRKAVIQKGVEAVYELGKIFIKCLPEILKDYESGRVKFAVETVVAVGKKMAELLEEEQKLISKGTGIVKQAQELTQQFSGATAALAGAISPTESDGSFADSLKGVHAHPEDELILNLMESLAMGTELPEGFTEATDKQLAELGLTRDMLRDQKSGLNSNVYIKDGKYYVIFEGTNDGYTHDFLNENIPGAIGTGPQTYQVMDIARKIEDSGNAGDVVFGGHSLGGRLAAVAAFETGSPAVTANAAGVSLDTKHRVAAYNNTSVEALNEAANNGLIRAYRTSNDTLTYAQESMGLSTAPGVNFDIPAHTSDGSFTSIEGHGIGYLNEAYRRNKP